MSTSPVLSNNDFKIAVVDDDPFIVTLVGRLMRRENFKVETATDGEKGWELIKAYAPDLVISDVMMPKLDGYELCHNIKNHKDLYGTYVILLTAKSQKEDVVRGLKCGADDYISKPFDKEELKARVDVGLRHISLQSELTRIEKNKSLGAVIGGISHLFNNLLGGIRGHLELAQENNSIDYAQSAMQTATENIDACALIIRNLAHYSENASLNRLDAVALGTLLQSSLETYRPILQKNKIQLTSTVDTLGEVNIDPKAMADILANLLSNSMQAMPKGGTIDVTLKEVKGQIKLIITDNGIGIPEERLAYVFDPFFTTKASRPIVEVSGRGLNGKDVPGHGLGLSVVQGIIHAHGGTVSIQSQENAGTTITILLQRITLE